MKLNRPAGSTNSTEILLAPNDAFDLVTDAKRYPDWLVGAQEIRSIDDDWPAVGARFEHRIGFGPFQIPGSTRVRVIERPHRFVLGAGMGPLGEAKVEFTVEPSGSASVVTVREVPSKGLARVAGLIWRPVIAASLWGRNHISLAALKSVAEESVAT